MSQPATTRRSVPLESLPPEMQAVLCEGIRGLVADFVGTPAARERTAARLAGKQEQRDRSERSTKE